MASEQDDWTLTVEQMFWMLNSRNVIEAFMKGDASGSAWVELAALIATDEFKALFGAMSFEEAYDRYTSMLEDAENAKLTTQIATMRQQRDALAAALKPVAALWKEWEALVLVGEADDSFVIWLAWEQEKATVGAFQAAADALAQLAEAGS